MGRYSLALRPKYGRDERTGGELVQQGIAGALDDYMKFQEAGRQERNTMGAAGATRLPDEPRMGVMDRLRGAGNAVRGVLRPTQTISANTPPVVPPTDVAPPRPTIKAAVNGAETAGRIFDPAPAASAVGANPAATAPVALAEATKRTGIANALDPYVYEGINGARYSVDPNRPERAKRAVAHEDEDRKVEALVAAGMNPNEARARVLNNVVRYDEEFGQYRRPVGASGTGGLSPGEWDRRERARQERRIEIEKLKTEGKLTPQEFARRRLALQEEAAKDRREREKAGAGREETKTDINLANAIDRGITDDPIATATMTDAQKADQARRIRERDDRLKRAGTSADRQKATRRARALAAEGKSREEILNILRREGIKVQ